MSFKRLDDPARRSALVPFLEAADTLTGHLVVVVRGQTDQMASDPKGGAIQWQRALNLKAKWTDHAFENMVERPT